MKRPNSIRGNGRDRISPGGFGQAPDLPPNAPALPLAVDRYGSRTVAFDWQVMLLGKPYLRRGQKSKGVILSRLRCRCGQDIQAVVGGAHGSNGLLFDLVFSGILSNDGRTFSRLALRSRSGSAQDCLSVRLPSSSRSVVQDFFQSTELHMLSENWNKSVLFFFVIKDTAWFHLINLTRFSILIFSTPYAVLIWSTVHVQMFDIIP